MPTILTSLTSQDIGSPALAGSTSRTGNAVTIQAGGADIYGEADQFHFAFQPHTGDFDLITRIETLGETDFYAKAGLMARATLDADSINVMAVVFPTNAARNNNIGGYEFQSRQKTGGLSAALYPPLPQPTVAYPNTWLRFRREGDTFLAYSSVDGSVWTEYSRLTLALPQTVHLGIAATSHNEAALTTARFHL